jgi:hypothetical protein
LGDVAEHLEMLEIACRKCGLYDRLNVAELIEEYGSDQALPGLLGTFTADCPRHRARPIRGWEFMRRDLAPRIVLPIIILAALASALLLFGLAATPIWVITPDASAPRSP